MNDFEIGASILGVLGVVFLFYNRNNTRPSPRPPTEPIMRAPYTDPSFRPKPTGYGNFSDYESVGGTRRKKNKSKRRR